MPALPDYYAVLGVSPDATAKEIKTRYHKLAMELHPDRGGSAEKLAAVNTAADVLTDAKKRAAYDADRKLDARKPGATKSPPPPPEAPKRPRQKVTVVLCPFCETMNRVKDDPDYVPATCGHCGRALGKAGKPGGATSPPPPPPPPPPPAAAKQEARPDEGDSYTKIFADAAQQLFGAQQAKTIPGADKVLEGLQEMAAHLAKRGKDELPPGERAKNKLDEIEEYLRKLRG